jgi:hypothetical protein
LNIHREKAELWQKMNDLEPVRPMVWINEIPWHEMDVDNELTIKSRHKWEQQQEMLMRREIYQWKHLPVDMVVSDYITCSLAIHSTEFGIVENVETVQTDSTSDIVSRYFNRQITELGDIEKNQAPKSITQ